ncbi:MAG TPA: hypothetical protein VG164_08110 [Trebonia sp.]|jgi:hypothetical protein|nr:hypothetical protein [Trebonia sp.]
MSGGDVQDLPAPSAPAASPEAMTEFACYVVNRLFSVGLSLESAHSIVGDGPAENRIAAATAEIDQLIRDVRVTLLEITGDPRASLNYRMARTARALQARALEAAALLEHRAAIARRPSPLDYPAEIKRWQAFARQAEQMASRLEQPP